MRKFTKTIWNQVQELIKKKKRNLYEINLKQKRNKLWKTLESMSLLSKAASVSNICLKDRNEIQKFEV